MLVGVENKVKRKGRRFFFIFYEVLVSHLRCSDCERSGQSAVKFRWWFKSHQSAVASRAGHNWRVSVRDWQRDECACVKLGRYRQEHLWSLSQTHTYAERGRAVTCFRSFLLRFFLYEALVLKNAINYLLISLFSACMWFRGGDVTIAVQYCLSIV